MSEVVVVGSANVDHRLVVADFPAPGQTVKAVEFDTGPGGKGANQAVAAARAGAKTQMIASIGADLAGQSLRQVLSQAGVDITKVQVSPGVPTGAAYVMVNGAGENSIIVAAGANGDLSAADLATLSPGDYVLLQLEIPLELVEEAIFKAHSRQAKVVVNVSPVDDRTRPFLGLIDVLLVNELELGQVAELIGLSAAEADVAVTARAVAKKLGNTVACTLGAKGALLVTGDELLAVDAPRVTAVDTTGAGDTFAGYLVAGLAAGDPIPDVLARAVAAGAIAVTKPGAINAVPLAAEVDRMLAKG
ncbi:MAG: ribokinase [Propionibacteriaceae bacterium]|jgi:ribokinase|nr:ribokinase [Propionibacteriaceae bacterium]